MAKSSTKGPRVSRKVAANARARSHEVNARELRELTPVTIFKIVPTTLWAEAQLAGRFTGSPADQQDGFIHLSTATQVRDTAAKHFAGVPDLQLVAVDKEALPIRWEPSRGGRLFPHLYEDLPLTAVKWTAPLPIGANGLHQFPPLD
jgi:uncharacterized protein (DUF952 family)